MISLRALFLFTFLLAVLVYLAGCKADPEPRHQQPEPMQLPSSVTLDFAALPQEAGGAGLDEVLVLVAEAGAMNFTYSREVGEELAATRVELKGVKQMKRRDLVEFVEELLAEHGYELSDVGPESLRVWLVATRSSSGNPSGNPGREGSNPL